MELQALSRKPLEEALVTLVSEFNASPYRFFTEADAVSRFDQLLNETGILAQTVTSRDGHDIPLAHREFPTFFRFADKNPTERLGSPAKRGHYDTVIIHPEHIAQNEAEQLTNRSIALVPEGEPPYLFAAIEFKLDRVGWSKARAKGAIAEVMKLELSNPEVDNCYFVLMMRYSAPTRKRWELYWDMVREYLDRAKGIKSLVGVAWLDDRASKSEVFRFGDWVI